MALFTSLSATALFIASASRRIYTRSCRSVQSLTGTRTTAWPAVTVSLIAIVSEMQLAGGRRDHFHTRCFRTALLIVDLSYSSWCLYQALLCRIEARRSLLARSSCCRRRRVWTFRRLYRAVCRYSDLREDDRAARSRVVDSSAAGIDNELVFAVPPTRSCSTAGLSPSQPGSTHRQCSAE